MKVPFRGHTYSVWWEYANDGNTTTCHISRPGETPDTTVTRSHTVNRYYKEKHSRENARKYSLAGVLKGWIDSKDGREVFWIHYLNRNEKTT